MTNYIDAAENLWYQRTLTQRLATHQEQTQLTLGKISEEVGPLPVLRIIDAVEGLETPRPPLEFVAAYSTYLYFSDLTS